jgi:hypothetical protein
MVRLSPGGASRVGAEGKCWCITGGGLFTSTNPESRRVVPQNIDGRVKVKVVYVVLEAQYQSSLTAAVKRINATKEEVMSRRGPTQKGGVSWEQNSVACIVGTPRLGGPIPGNLTSCRGARGLELCVHHAY